MRIAIAGATGFIGKKLIQSFLSKNWQITEIRRKDFELPDDEFIELIADAEVIINLAGAPILKRWTFSYKKELISSRIQTTRKLRNAISTMKRKPQLFISTSAVGFYPEGGPYTESDRSYFPSFLSDLCRDWENEALLIENDCRLVIFRFGVILDSKEGALKKMLPLFKLGLGGKIGLGKQGFSWVHITDLLNTYTFVIENQECKGIYNLTAPNPVNNAELTHILAKTLGRPAFMRVPVFFMKLVYGEAAVTLVEGPKVLPKRLLDAGFNFTFPELGPALHDLLRK
jgi:uncharacterized protein